MIFIEGAGKYDQMDCLVDGVCASSVQCPKQGIIPHDMLHVVVETMLTRRGFTIRTIEGDPSGFRLTSTVESDGVKRLVEVLQADGSADWTSAASALVDLSRVSCEARH